MMDPMRALERIWDIVHIPTKETKHKGMLDHCQADFDAIRKQIQPFIDAGFLEPNSQRQKDSQQ